MAQVSDKLNVQPTRSLSLVSILPLIFGILMLVGTFLPQVTPANESIQPPTTMILGLSVIAIGLALWTIYDVRARLTSSMLGVLIGVIAVITLFNYVGDLSALNAGVEVADRVRVGIGIWVSLIGAAGLIFQIFIPRPRLTGVEVYGEAGLRDFMARMGVLGELLRFLWKRKLYWLIPMVLTLMIFIVLIAAGSNSVIAPFIYTLF